MKDKNKDLYELIAKSKDSPFAQEVHETILEIEQTDPHRLTKILDLLKEKLMEGKGTEA